MNRRLLLATGAWWTLGLGACTMAPRAQAQPSYKVSLEQLERVLARRFPLRYAVSGLLDIEMREPRLRLMPELNRLGSELPMGGQAGARRQAACANLSSERVDQLLVAGVSHAAMYP